MPGKYKTDYIYIYIQNINLFKTLLKKQEQESLNQCGNVQRFDGTALFCSQTMAFAV